MDVCIEVILNHSVIILKRRMLSKKQPLHTDMPSNATVVVVGWWNHTDRLFSCVRCLNSILSKNMLEVLRGRVISWKKLKEKSCLASLYGTHTHVCVSVWVGYNYLMKAEPRATICWIPSPVPVKWQQFQPSYVKWMYVIHGLFMEM